MQTYAFHQNRIWVRETDSERAWAALQPPVDAAALGTAERYRSFDGTREICAVDCREAPQPGAGERLVGLRELHDCLPSAEFAEAQRAFQLVNWRRTHRFCGVCGAPLNRKAGGECAMTCPSCGLDFFPRLNPVVITRITRGDRILLARRARGALPFFSVIAGFVEAGETLEAAVAREIREEVGLEVRNIRYFGSQPWPFPNNLMIGFTAEHASGDIRVDGEEIGEAAWFARDALPPIPHPISISRWMIDDFIRML